MAMHCPQCLTEYRDGFTECADCRVPLSPGPAPKPADQGHKVDPVTVFETHDPFAFNLAKGTLEDAGIEFVIGGDNYEELGLSGITPAGALATRIQVAAARANEARELLEPLIHPEPIADEETS